MFVTLACSHTCAETLNIYLQMHPELEEKTEVLLDMATQICAAMKYLEARGIMHRDVVCISYHSAS